MKAEVLVNTRTVMKLVTEEVKTLQITLEGEEIGMFKAIIGTTSGNEVVRKAHKPYYGKTFDLPDVAHRTGILLGALYHACEKIVP